MIENILPIVKNVLIDCVRVKKSHLINWSGCDRRKNKLSGHHTQACGTLEEGHQSIITCTFLLRTQELIKDHWSVRWSLCIEKNAFVLEPF